MQTSKGMLAAILLSLPLFDCTNDTTGNVLIVAPVETSAQPNSENLGLLVTIQAKGGSTLTLRTRNGQHRATGQANLHRASCIAIPHAATELQTLHVTVVPDDQETILDVELLEETLQPAQNPTDDVVCDKPGTVILSQSKSITVERTNETKNAESSSSSSSGSAGNGGEGGTANGSSSSSGSGSSGGGGNGGMGGGT